MIQEIKKLGLKINSLARKIEEADRSGMTSRIEGYVEELNKAKEKLNSKIEEFSKNLLNNI